MESIESFESLDDLVAGIGFEAESVISGDSPPEPQSPDTSPVQVEPPVSEPVSNEAPPAVDAAAEPPVDESSATPPEPEPQKPIWESDENPYFKQANTLTQALQRAAQNVQQRQLAEEYAAREQILNQLPNMDPVQAQIVRAQLDAWDREQAQTRVQAVEAEYEPIAQELAIRRLSERLSLTVDERKELEQFRDPQQMAWAAQQMAANRKQRETEKSELQKQISELTMRVQAQERMQSPADRVAAGVGGPSTNLQNVTNLDDFLDNLNLPTGGRWG